MFTISLNDFTDFNNVLRIVFLTTRKPVVIYT